MGHAEIVPSLDLVKSEHQSYYLPIHGVHKESSTTTKLRVVFDASAKTTSDNSLNDVLLSGPNLYPLLTEVKIRFLLHPICLSADISKMFCELELDAQDRDLYRYV